jgi:homospermidine synthase
MNEKKHVKFQGRLVLVGFGSVGQGSLPLLLRHIDMPRDRIRILTGDTRGAEEAKQLGIRFPSNRLRARIIAFLLDPLVAKGDFLLNLSVEVSSVALIEYCRKRGVMYLDTCIEPWLGGYTDTNGIGIAPLNYGLREEPEASHPIPECRADGDPDARRQSRPDFALGQAGIDQSFA